MSLFPILDTGYQIDGDRSVQEMMEYYYSQSIQINQSFWSEADIDTRFLAGDQTLWNDIYGNLPANRRKQFNFNRIRRVINMITGYQRQHRLSTIVTPTESSDQDVSDQLSKALFWANRNANTLENISDAFYGSCTTGMNLLSIWMDYRDDPINGDIKVDNVAYNEYLIDPYFKKKDLSDCRFLWKRNWLSKTEIASILPDRANEIEDMQSRGWRDGKFQYMPQSYNYAMQDLLTYDEFWYLTYRKRKLLVDRETGQTMEWTGDDDNLALYKRHFPSITTVDQQCPTANLAITVNGRTMYNGSNPMGIDRMPFVPVLAYYMPEIPYFPYRCQGVVRGLRDSQYLYNRRKVIELDILESQINSGIKFADDALVNPKDAFLTGQGRSLAIKGEAVIKYGGLDGAVKEIPAPSVPSSMMELSSMLAKEIQEISGINEELLGTATDDKAGILSMLRQGAGLTTLQILFDQLDFAQKEVGKIFIDLIQKNFSPGKIQRIINEEPAPEFYNRNFGKYDCEVEEGLNTATQKQLQFAQLLQLRQLEVPIPTSLLIEASTLQNKKQLIEALQRQEQQASEMENEKKKLEMLINQAKIEMMEAKATADQGLGIERLARVQENKALAVERMANADKDLADSILTRVKAAKEIEEMDILNAERILKIVDTLKRQEEAENEASIQQSQNLGQNLFNEITNSGNQTNNQQPTEQQVM
jgi:hypothetical protein